MKRYALWFIFFLSLLTTFAVEAKKYNLPNQSLPGCTQNGTTYTCGTLTLNSGDEIEVTGNEGVVIIVEAVDFGDGVTINSKGPALDMQFLSGGQTTIGPDSSVNASFDSDGDVVISDGTTVTGDISSNGNITLGDDVTVDGDLSASGTVTIGADSTVSGDVNAPVINNGGTIEGSTCNTPGNVGDCSQTLPEAIGYWNFDELSWSGVAGEVVDSSDYGYNGTAISNAFTSGFNPAREFNGDSTCRYGRFDGNNRARVPNVNEAMNSDTVSVAFWFKGAAELQNPNDSYQTMLLLGEGTTETAAGRFEVYRQDDSDGGGLYFEVRKNNGDLLTIEAGNINNGGENLFDDEWHHLAASYNSDNNVLYIYIDGELVDTNSYGGDTKLNDEAQPTLYIGGQSGPQNSFRGEIDEVYVSNGVFTPTTAAILYYKTRPCAYARPQCSDVWPQAFSPVNETPLPFDLPDRTLNSQLPATLQPTDYLREGDFDDVGEDYFTNGQTSRVYIDGNLTIQSGRRINTAGEANELILIVTGDLYIGRDVEINGFIYVQGDFYFQRSILPWFRSVVEGGLSVNGQAYAYGFPGLFAPQIDYRLPAEPLDGGNFCEAGDVDPPVAAPHHYRLSYSSPALTCEAAEVTVEACADASCSSYSPVSSSVFLSDSAGDWSQNPVAASPVATTQLSQTEAGDYTLAIDDIQTTPGALNPTQCYVNGNFDSDCSITFNDTGLKFDSIGTQTSGDSFLTNLSVVRTNDNTQACEVVAAQVNQIEVGMHCINPGSCSDFSEFPYAQMSAKTPNEEYTLLNELQEDGAGGFSGWAPVAADFQVGQQTLEVQYGDAGKVNLRAKAQLPNGKVIEGVSNEFVYKPASIGMETVSSYSGDILAKAGEPFFVALQALNTGDQVTPNFGRETPQELLDLMSTTTAVAPSVEDGEIENASGFIAQSVESIHFENDSISYSEVGSAKVVAKVVDGNYLGAGPLTTDHIIGRFIPYEFEPLTAEFSGTCTDFYYMGQSQPVSLSAQAVNASGNKTLNYTGSLAKAEPLFYAYDSSGNQIVDHAVSYDGTWEWVDGVGQFTGNASVSVSRLSSGQPDGPFRNYILGWQLDDQEDGNFYSTLQNSDLSASYGAAELDSANLYYGRLNLQDTYAAMDDVMPIAGAVEYWESGEFYANDADNCTVVDRSAVSLLDESMAILEPTPVNVKPTNGLLSSPNKDINQLLRWTSSGGDEPYSFIFELDVPDYLKYDWPYNDGEVEDGSDFTDNPQAEGTFGIYRGRDRQIYWRELGW